MNHPRRTRSHSLGAVRSLGVWAALAVLVWADSTNTLAVEHADIFSAIVLAFQFIWNVVQAVGTVIAVSLQAVVGWLVAMVGWLGGSLAALLTNMGGMFARVWESARLLYDAVLKPALVWIHDVFARVHGWLERVFAPVLKFLDRVREELLAAYQRFVRPILDILDIAHIVFKTLGDLGLGFARALDRWVTQAQDVITENFSFLLRAINRAQDTLDRVVTFDHLFQRLAFVRTLERDAGYFIRLWWNKQIVGLSKAQRDARRAEKFRHGDPAGYGAELEKFYRTREGDFAGVIADVVPVWDRAAGHAPPDTADV